VHVVPTGIATVDRTPYFLRVKRRRRQPNWWGGKLCRRRESTIKHWKVSVRVELRLDGASQDLGFANEVRTLAHADGASPIFHRTEKKL